MNWYEIFQMIVQRDKVRFLGYLPGKDRYILAKTEKAYDDYMKEELIDITFVNENGERKSQDTGRIERGAYRSYSPALHRFRIRAIAKQIASLERLQVLE